MLSTRRGFIRSVGIGLASLVMARCLPYGGNSERAKDLLRECWWKLDWLAQETTGDHERGEKARDHLAVQHKEILDDLVDAGVLSVEVSRELDNAFNAAITHVYLSNAPITCYKPALLNYTPTSSAQLIQQAELLEEITRSGDLDSTTVDQAKSAIARDIAFLNLTNEETQTLYEALIEAAGESYNFPHFDKLELKIPPEATEAARFLVELLLAE